KSECDRIFITCAAIGRLLLVRRLGVGVVRLRLVGLVMTDHAACGRSQLAVTRHMAGNAADNSTFDAAFGVGGTERSQRKSRDTGGCKDEFHGETPSVVSSTNAGRARSVPSTLHRHARPVAAAPPRSLRLANGGHAPPHGGALPALR